MPQAKTQAKAQPKAQTEQTAQTQPGADQAPEKAPQKVPALRVSSHLRQGHRRAGLRWPKEGRTLELSLLSNAEVEALKADPNLTVREVEIDAPEQSA